MSNEHLLGLAVPLDFLYGLKSGTTEQVPRCLIRRLGLSPNIVQAEPLKPLPDAVLDDTETDSASPPFGEHLIGDLDPRPAFVPRQPAESDDCP